MAIEAALVSRAEPTTKASSRTVPGCAEPVAPPTGSKMKSRRTVAPGVTWTEAFCGSRPVKKTRRVTTPAGRPGSRYSPKASVKASRLEPATVRRAFSSAAPPMLFCTRPVSVPVAGVWVRLP